jgi:hypothetical protein
VLIGWQLPTHAHAHVDTRTALGAAAWPLDLFPQWVTVIVVGGSGVAHTLQNPMGSSQGQRTPRQDGLPSTLSATTAFVLETRRGVGLSLDRQGAMLAIAVDVVATGLQDEGATLFANAWNERSRGSASQSVTLAPAR